MTYDYADQIISTLAPTGLDKDFIYDSMCRIVKATDSTGGFVDYTYDAAGNILTESDALGRVAEYKYDTLGRLISETGRDGETYTYTYDALSRVTSMTDPEKHVTKYEYDYRDNLVKVVEFDGSTYTYEYDELGQLVKTTNPIRAVTQYEYDLLGNVTKTTNAEGNSTTVDYDAISRITKVTEANNAETSYTYDAVGNVISVKSPLGNVSEYQYDSVGNLIKYKDSENYITQYTYDLLGNLKTETSPRNAVTSYEYDGAKNVTKVTDAEGYVTAYDYLPDGVLSKLTQANGGTYSYEYDTLDRVTKVTDPEGYFRSFTYDENGDVIAETDNLEINNTYTYDIMHRMIQSTEEGIATKYSYDERGNLAKVVMPNNATYSYEYDSIGRMEAMTDPLGLTTEYSYDFTDNLIVENKGDAAKTTYVYDSVGNNICISDPMDGVWRFTYDLEGNMVKSTDALGNSVTAAYDTIGRATSYTDQLGETTVLAYDPHSNVIGVNDAKNQTATYTYDLVDNLTSVKDANGSVTEYTYDSMGNLIGATNANGSKTSYTYNLRGDLTSVTSPMGQVEQYKYDISGKLTEYVKPSGTEISYDYDKLNNLIQKEAGDETPVTYGYDSMGQRVTMKDATGEVQYSYDAAGNATKVIHHNGKTVTYEYDKFGRLSKLTYPDGSVTAYEYDLNDQLVKVTGHDGGVTTYTYDANGNVTSCTRSNNTKTNYTYNERGDLVLLENIRTNKNNALLSSYAYEYDANGYIVKETEKVDKYTYVREYTYDAAGQLVAYTELTAHLTSLLKSSLIKYSYTYDGAGNRTGMVYYDEDGEKYWTDYVYNANNELVSETANEYGLLGKVKSEKTNYTYDVDGNLVKKSTGKLSSNIWTYYYTAENRLEAVKKGSTLLMAATYDGDNNRIFDITYTSASGNADFDSEIRSAYVKENGVTLSWKCIDPACHKHFDHENCQILHPKKDEDNKDFIKSVLDETVVVAGEELLPVKKTSSDYLGYDLTYYLNDVTIDNAEVLVEYDSDGLAKGTYQYGLDRLSVEYGNTMSQYFLYNGTGSVVQTAEENGSLALRYTYDPFGTPSVRSPGSVSLADTPSYTYNGESYNYTTGLQYLRARYYSPNTASFISQDTYLGDILNSVTLNRYTYANNNPVMYDDPSGHWALWDNFKESVSDFANDVKDTVTEGYNKVKDKVVEVYNDAKDFVEEKIEQAKEFVQDVSCQATIKAAEAAVDVFGADNVTKTVNTVNNTVKQAKQWVDDKWEQACEFSQDKLGIDLERTVNGVMKVVNTVGTVAAAVTAFSVAMAATGGLALVAAPVLMGFASVSAVYSVAEGIEGLQDVYYGMQGDSETQSFNFVRDTIYADNPDLYYQHKAIADTGTAILTAGVGKLNAKSNSKSSIKSADPTDVNSSVNTRSAIGTKNQDVPTISDYTDKIDYDVNDTKFYSVKNSSDGDVWVSNNEINMYEYESIVNRSVAEGKHVNIISGTHGDLDGKLHIEYDFYTADKKYYNTYYGKNVTVYDINGMSGNKFSEVINSGDTTIMAWCYSDRSQKVINALNLKQ